MKKIFSLFFISVFIIIFSSCTADVDDTSQFKLVKKIIEVNKDETSLTINFAYDGDKIVSIDSELSNTTFTYSGNLITKIIQLDKTSQDQKTFDYFYTNDNLTKVISSDNYTLNYTYQSGGKIAYEKTSTDSNINIVLVCNGTLSIQYNNVVQKNKTLNTSGVNILEKEELSFAYDNKSNPLRNIVGFNKLLDHSELISANNYYTNIVISSTKYLDTEAEVSSAVVISKNYNYDKEGYPKEVISTKPVFGKEDKNHLKTLYFY